MILLNLAAVLLYLFAGITLARGYFHASTTMRAVGVACAILAVLAHAFLIAQAMATPAGWDVNFIYTLSLAALMITTMLLVTSPWARTLESGILAFPGAALCVALQWLLDPAPLVLTQVSGILEVHVFTSLLAYSLLSIAAINAVMLAIQDYVLRHPRPIRQIELLPPLAVIETLMFRLIAVGWAVLTLSLITGVVFIEDMFAQHLAHKTVLSILSWTLFGLLLAGRWWYGWRGRSAVNLALAAMIVLALAYFGSKMVLEVFLDRSWMLPPDS